MHAFYADQFVLPLPDGHRFPMSKYGMLRNWLQENLPQVSMQVAPPARDEQLALVHTSAYIRGISLGPEQGGLDPKIMREIGFPWSEAMAERARQVARWPQTRPEVEAVLHPAIESVPGHEKLAELMPEIDLRPQI